MVSSILINTKSMKQKNGSKIIGDNKSPLQSPIMKKIETQEIQQNIPNNYFNEGNARIEMQDYRNNNLEYQQNYGNQPPTYLNSNENNLNDLRNPVFVHPQANMNFNPNQQQYFNQNINMMQYQPNFHPNNYPY